MTSRRRSLVATLSMLVLVVLQLVLDPTGLLALVGWSGATPAFDRLWTLAPYVVFVPVLLLVTWWVAARAGERYWTLVPGLVLAVMLAQSAMALVMTLDLATAGWASAYVTAKAVPAALIVAAITRLAGGRGERTLRTAQSFLAPAVWAPALLFAAAAPLLPGLWWTSAVYAPEVPAPRIDRGILSALLGMALVAVTTAVMLRWMRRRVTGVLGGWLAAVVAGAAVGVIQAVVAVAFDGMPSADLWPLMTLYVTVADGLSFGACVGWIVGFTAVLAERLRLGRAGDTALIVAGAAAVVVMGIVVVSALVPTAPKPAASLSDAFLRADGGVIRDGDGNQVLLRGVNVNQLVDFYAPQPDVPVTTPLTEEDFDGIASYGFTVVRLGFSWSALEPERGTLDRAYLAQITDAVGWAKERGIYVVLDMHQDSWYNGGTPEGAECRAGTSPMWGYDGAPDWATITDGAPRCQFEGRDISPASNRAFQNFFFDTDGIQTAFVETWAQLAARFADEPAVAGFDLLNEPGFGETAPVTTSYLLGRFYDRAITAIRDAGAGQIVFFEPSILWSGLGFDSGPPVGFTDDTNVVFSPHLYAESITMDRSLGIPPIVGMERQFALAQRMADRYGVPLWSGEYGYWGDIADRSARLERYAHLEDDYRIGSAYWVWKQACGDPQNGIGPVGDALIPQDCETEEFAEPLTEILDILSRAYPRVSPGTLASLEADGSSMTMSGTLQSESCGLDVWVPGAEKPEVDAEGVTDLEFVDRGTGWDITGCAEGDYTLSVGG